MALKGVLEGLGVEAGSTLHGYLVCPRQGSPSLVCQEGGRGGKEEAEEEATDGDEYGRGMHKGRGSHL